MLSAFSEHFNGQETTFEHPDLPVASVLGVLQYMYTGEVRVPFPHIKSFSRAAEKLGLSVGFALYLSTAIIRRFMRFIFFSCQLSQKMAMTSAKGKKLEEM